MHDYSLFLNHAEPDFVNTAAERIVLVGHEKVPEWPLPQLPPRGNRSCRRPFPQTALVVVQPPETSFSNTTGRPNNIQYQALLIYSSLGATGLVVIQGRGNVQGSSPALSGMWGSPSPAYPDMSNVRRRQRPVRGARPECASTEMSPLSTYLWLGKRHSTHVSQVCSLVSRSDWGTVERLSLAPSGFGRSGEETQPVKKFPHHSTASAYPSQAIASTILMAPPIQRTMPNPSFTLDNQPPQIPPTSTMTAAAALRFRFAFCKSQSFGSLARSLYTLVKTVVGISLYPNARLAATCAPNCQARKGIPIRTRSLLALFSGIASVVIKMAATSMDSP